MVFKAMELTSWGPMGRERREGPKTEPWVPQFRVREVEGLAEETGTEQLQGRWGERSKKGSRAPEDTPRGCSGRSDSRV